MATTTTFQTNLMNLQSNLLNFAFMLTSNRDDAYDLLQDTTLKALDNQDKYAENTNFKAWVMTIMRNLFINNYRRSVRNATVVDTTDKQPDGLRSAMPPHAAGNADAHELSAREIEVLVLITKGLINKEIADKLNISLTTVITHRKNIVEKLGIKSVSGLTIYAVMHGYIDADRI